MKKMTLIVPSYGGHVNLERTINSCRPIIDEVVIISTAFFEEDKAHFARVADRVIELPWNFVFLHGHGSLHNQASAHAKNDWLLLLGVAETWAESYVPNVGEWLEGASAQTVFRCNHVNDPHTWKRIWNRTGGTQWSGIMHEEIAMGRDGGLLFRMQDTDKIPSLDPFKDEARRWIKALSYNWLYSELIRHPERLGAAGQGWLKFVAGAKDTIMGFCEDNAAMLAACVTGDLSAFLKLVADSKEEWKQAYGVNFHPQGYENLLSTSNEQPK